MEMGLGALRLPFPPLTTTVEAAAAAAAAAAARGVGCLAGYSRRR